MRDSRDSLQTKDELVAGARYAAAAWLDTAGVGSPTVEMDLAGRRVLVECAHFGRFRNRRGDWAHLLREFRPRPAMTSHGVCPTCLDRHFPEVYVRSMVRAAKGNG